MDVYTLVPVQDRFWNESIDLYSGFRHYFQNLLIH